MTYTVSLAGIARSITTFGFAVSWLLSPGVHAQGSLEVWGSDFYNGVSFAPAGTSFIQVAGGISSGVGLRADGTL